MKSIKLLLLICIAVSFSQCKSMKLTENAPFKITGATYHSWVGGQPGVSGTNLIIGVENDANITFKKVYFQNKVVDASIENRKGKKYVIANISTSNRRQLGYVKQTITIKNAEVFPNQGTIPDTKQQKIRAPKFPFNQEPNEAVISYMSGKKTYYYKVSKVKKTETIFYP